MTRHNPPLHTARKPRVFLDSSALIAAILSLRDDSASRRLLHLGEANAIDLRVSREVLRDTEYLIRRRNSSLLPLLALLLDQANVQIVSNGSREMVEQCMDMTGYLPDARVLAAAVDCGADIFATYDTEHFLQNPLIGPPRTHLRVMNAHQTVEWCLAQLLLTSQDDAEDLDGAN